MDLLLLNSPNVWAGVKRPIFPLGLAYIGTFLRNYGHNVRLIDLNICSGHSQKFKDLLQKNSFKFIGISIRTAFYYQTPQIYQWRNVINTIKSFSPDSKIICGGGAFSLLPQQIMDSIKEIDMGVIGRGEEAFLELINKSPQEVKGIIYRNGKGIHFTPPREEVDLDSLPIPKRDWPDLDLSQYDALNMQTRRGCPFKCRHCANKYFEGEKVKCRSISSVHKEIGYLSSLGIKKFFFTDNVFNYPLEYSLEIIDILKKYDLEWGAFFRVNLLNKCYAKALLESKCKIVMIGAESGSQEMHNYLDTGILTGNILNVLDICHSLARNKVVVIFSFMVGLPKERLTDVFMTFMLIIRIFLKKCFVHISPCMHGLKDAKNVSLKSPPVNKKVAYPFYWALVLFDFIKKSKAYLKKF